MAEINYDACCVIDDLLYLEFVDGTGLEIPLDQIALAVTTPGYLRPTSNVLPEKEQEKPEAIYFDNIFQNTLMVSTEESKT